MSNEITAPSPTLQKAFKEIKKISDDILELTFIKIILWDSKIDDTRYPRKYYYCNRK